MFQRRFISIKNIFKMGNLFGSNETSFVGSIPQSFYSITEKDSDGNEVSFEKFRGKVVYGVNVASNCGYTKSGYDLIRRVAAMKDKGVEVALFPCNQVSLLIYLKKLLNEFPLCSFYGRRYETLHSSILCYSI
jgi:hypothetical protein